MSKQVYQVKNAQGQVIGARQSARPYICAAIHGSQVLSYSSSEQGALRGGRKECKWLKLNTAALEIVPVECVGEVAPVKLTVDGYDITVKTFNVYKYAVINVDTGDLEWFAKREEAFHYTLEQAQTYMMCKNGERLRDGTSRPNGKNLKIVKMTDPRTAPEPAPAVEQAPVVEPAPARVENFVSFDRKVIVNELLSKVPVFVDQEEVGHIACISVKGRHRVKAGFCNHKYTVIFNNGTEKDFLITDYRSHAEAYGDARKYAIHAAPRR